MKKSTFMAMMLGTVSGVLFALGMCMALLPEWNVFVPGIVLGCAGLILGLITLLIWRKMEHKAPLRISKKAMGLGAVGVFGVLALGVGMCCTMVWDQMILGIVIGLVGILALLSSIPLAKGFK